MTRHGEFLAACLSMSPLWGVEARGNADLSCVLRRFFEDYKKNENKEVKVDEILGREEALTAIKDAMVRSYCSNLPTVATTSSPLCLCTWATHWWLDVFQLPRHPLSCACPGALQGKLCAQARAGWLMYALVAGIRQALYRDNFVPKKAR